MRPPRKRLPSEPPRRIGLVFYVKNRLASQLTGALARWLQQHGVEVTLEAQCGATLASGPRLAPMDELIRQIDLLVPVGGDGTLLHAARYAARTGVPLLGVNRGTMGFLTELSPQQAFDGFERLLRGEFHVEARMMIDVRVRRKGRQVASYLGLNDAVVKRDISRILRYELTLNGEYLDSFPGDGVIVSTPTGSTAYSLSAGGPIVKPDVRVLLVCPICPHRFYGRSLVIDAADVLDISFRAHTATDVEDVEATRGLCLTVDGQSTCSLDSSHTVQIRRSRHYTHLVRFPDSDFFRVLRTKLG